MPFILGLGVGAKIGITIRVQVRVWVGVGHGIEFGVEFRVGIRVGVRVSVGVRTRVGDPWRGLEKGLGLGLGLVRGFEFEPEFGLGSGLELALEFRIGPCALLLQPSNVKHSRGRYRTRQIGRGLTVNTSSCREHSDKAGCQPPPPLPRPLGANPAALGGLIVTALPPDREPPDAFRRFNRSAINTHGCNLADVAPSAASAALHHFPPLMYAKLRVMALDCKRAQRSPALAWDFFTARKYPCS